jgi:hypothetical protein
MLASGSLVLTLVWGLILAHADQEFARVYPRAARDLSQIVKSMKSYSVGEWGFRYYLGRTGTRPLPVDESPIRGGSFVAIPKLALPYDIPAGLRSMLMPVQTFAYNSKTPLRTLDWQTPAGFYSSGWGLIPFSLSRKNLEEIELFQVNFMVERLPGAQVDIVANIKPWPGYLTVRGQSSLAVLAKPGTRIIYPFPVDKPVRLELQCGISPDSYREGSDTSCRFEIRQIGADDSVLVESQLALQPGLNINDRDWQPVLITLKQTAKGALDFRFACSGNESACTGAFARSILRPID